MKKYLLAGLVVAGVTLLVWMGVTPVGAPRAEGIGAPAARFSAARGLRLMRAAGDAPRPIGSPGALRARALIVSTLRGLGLAPRLQSAVEVSGFQAGVAGSVHNVVAVLPGRASTRAVLLCAHYDSVAVAPGAADDLSGVATLLETARTLAAGPRLRDDVIFLFTDGEERGLLGSRAFLRDDPLARGVGVVLDFDSPGSSTPAPMYEGSHGNGLLVGTLLAAGPHAYASSLMYEVSRRLPVVSDFRPFRAAGYPGMAFGAVDGPGYNHTAYDSLARFSAASLQHEGDTALALARRFAGMDLRAARRDDVVYFDVVDGLSVSYGAGAAVAVALAAVGAFAAAAVVAVRRRLLTLRGVGLSVAAVGGALAAAAAVMAVAWGMYGSAYERHVWSGSGVVISDQYRLGLVLLTTAVVVGVYWMLLRRLRPWDLAFAALGWWAPPAVVVAVLVPGASYLLAWPLLAAALGLLAAAALAGEAAVGTVRGVLLTLAGAAPGVLLMSASTYLLLLSAGLKLVATVLAVWLVAGLLVLPLAATLRALRIWLPVALASAGILVLFLVGSAVAFDVQHPRFTSIYYRVDPAGTAHWQSIDPIDPWTAQFLGSRLRWPAAASYFPGMGTQMTIDGAAPPASLPAPRIVVLSDTAAAGRRTVRLCLRSPRGAAVVSLLVQSVVGELSATVGGHPLGRRDTTVLDGTNVRWSLDYYQPPPAGVVVKLEFAAGAPVLLRVVDMTYGMPPALTGLYRARPATMLPGRLGDATLVDRTVLLPATPRPGR